MQGSIAHFAYGIKVRKTSEWMVKLELELPGDLPFLNPPKTKQALNLCSSGIVQFCYGQRVRNNHLGLITTKCVGTALRTISHHNFTISQNTLLLFGQVVVLCGTVQ